MTPSGWHTYGIVGSGDIIGLLPSGRHLEIECKSGRGGRLSTAQQKRMADIRGNNGLYLVVCSVEELEQCFAEQVEMRHAITGDEKQFDLEGSAEDGQ